MLYFNCKTFCDSQMRIWFWAGTFHFMNQNYVSLGDKLFSSSVIHVDPFLWLLNVVIEFNVSTDSVLAGVHHLEPQFVLWPRVNTFPYNSIFRTVISTEVSEVSEVSSRRSPEVLSKNRKIQGKHRRWRLWVMVLVLDLSLLKSSTLIVLIINWGYV